MSLLLPTDNLRVLAMTTPPKASRQTPANRIEFTAAMVETIRLERSKLTPWKDIAAMLGVSLGTLHRRATEHGIDTKERRKPPPSPEYEAQSAKIREMWPNGAISLAAISREVGLDCSTVRKRASVLDLGPRPRLLDAAKSPAQAARRARADGWPDEDKQALRALWREGLSYSLIAKRMGRTKGAVVGCAFRLQLPARTEPTGNRRKPREARQAEPKPRMATGPGVAAPPPRRKTPIVPSYGKSEPCCWVMGEPAGRNTRYCEAPSLPRQPYCEDHYCATHVLAPRPRIEVADAA